MRCRQSCHRLECAPGAVKRSSVVIIWFGREASIPDWCLQSPSSSLLSFQDHPAASSVRHSGEPRESPRVPGLNRGMIFSGQGSPPRFALGARSRPLGGSSSSGKRDLTGVCRCSTGTPLVCGSVLTCRKGRPTSRHPQLTRTSLGNNPKPCSPMLWGSVRSRHLSEPGVPFAKCW